MSQLATITSKKQLTLPAELFRKVGFKIGQKVVVSEQNGSITITSAEKLVKDLAGSLPMPKKWQGKSIESIKEEAITEYFRHKYKK